MVHDHSTSGSMTLPIRPSTSTPAARFFCEQPVGVGEHVVAQVHDEELRRQRLAGVPRRALGLAAPALGAGGHVEQLLPGEVLHAAGTEDGLVLVADVLHGHVRGGGEGAQGPGAPGGGDVDRGQEDVEVLRVGHEDQEAHDDGDVDQQEGRLEDAVDAGAQRGEGPGQGVGGEGPLPVGEVAGVDLGGPVEQQRA